MYGTRTSAHRAWVLLPLLVLFAGTGSVARSEEALPVVVVEPIPEPAMPVFERIARPALPDAENLEQMIKAFRLARLAQELRLKEEEAVRMAVRMREIDEERLKIETLRRTVLPQIEREILRSDVERQEIDEGRLRELIEQFHSQSKRHHEQMQKLEDRLRELLSVEQQARMLLYQGRFEHELQEMIQMARDGRHPVPAPRPPRQESSPEKERPARHEPPPKKLEESPR